MALILQSDKIGVGNRNVNADPISETDTESCLAMKDITGLEFNTTNRKITYWCHPEFFHSQLFQFEFGDYNVQIPVATTIADDGTGKVLPVRISPISDIAGGAFRFLDTEIFIMIGGYKRPLPMRLHYDFRTGMANSIESIVSTKVKPFRWAVLHDSIHPTQLTDTFLFGYVPVEYDDEGHYHSVSGSAIIRFYYDGKRNDFSIEASNIRYDIGTSSDAVTWNLL